MTNAATAYRPATAHEWNCRRLLNACMALGLSFVLFAAAPSVHAQGASPQAQTPADPWPRDIPLSNAVVTVYQPQVEKWEGDTLQFRAAVAARPSGGNETFGVIWGEAHTEVDRVARMVTLSGVSLTRIKFPTLSDNGSSYL